MSFPEEPGTRLIQAPMFDSRILAFFTERVDPHIIHAETHGTLPMEDPTEPYGSQMFSILTKRYGFDQFLCWECGFPVEKDRIGQYPLAYPGALCGFCLNKGEYKTMNETKKFPSNPRVGKEEQEEVLKLSREFLLKEKKRDPDKRFYLTFNPQNYRMGELSQLIGPTKFCLALQPLRVEQQWKYNLMILVPEWLFQSWVDKLRQAVEKKEHKYGFSLTYREQNLNINFKYSWFSWNDQEIYGCPYVLATVSKEKEVFKYFIGFGSFDNILVSKEARRPAIITITALILKTILESKS